MCEKLVCPVCFRHCRLGEGQTGFCLARTAQGGKSVPLHYGHITALALDPVEKKPLARFFPGRSVLSVGSIGCNLDCPFCQNSRISREPDALWRNLMPEELAGLARSLAARGSIGAAFTYNEPMVGFEYVRDAARAVRAAGMKNVVVTNGSVCTDVLEEVLGFVDAFNIDLKSFTPEGYRRLGGDLETVQAFIRRAAASSHVELTALIVPGENDTDREMRELSAWVAGVDRTIPLHVTRFFPRRRMLDTPPTPTETLYRLAAAAREKLDTVLVGNV